ncbi:hypothetical protein BLA24_21335 [Streptomyces cinnamoneus]|uniref:YcxB-like C-terminal domain-containing protein n=1 Tax=Streptomyces cinnamoneus TaxID=53446 RepID=A0A2G1XFW2_STRCJ|nr:hypothetical protein BLA24_21335 [Streptomyces cinnamoneus]PPT13089.1 hypothetical protein CYQ11_09450 [Streptomyces cinnamoneus]
MAAPVPAHADSLTFDYELTVADMRSALRARARVVRSARLQKVLLPLCYAVFAAGILVKGPEARDWPPLVICGLVAVFALVGGPVLQARSLHKALQGQGPRHTTVAAGGMAASWAHGSQSMAWSAFGRYTETKDHFVLLSPDKRGACLVILPKRALAAPGDADRLRALLDAGLPRA